MASRNTKTPQRSRGRLGPYDLRRTLGSGGFGKVYLAEHVHLHTERAVKLLHAHLVDEQAEQFKREARMIARLPPHRHIMRVLDYNIQNGRPYIVMDYAPHGNLRQRHTFGEKVSLPRVVSYVKQAALGLQFTHGFGIVHCDIKPENMFVGRLGEVVIGDFGIAIGLQEENAQSEDTFGTIPYMSPEQILGHPEPASDQYSLAVVAYEWLTGQLPFTGSDKYEIARKHLQEQPQSMRAINPSIPVAVEQVVMKALAKEPAQRYPDILAFAQALERASQPARPVPIRPPSSGRKSIWRQATRPGSHHPYRNYFFLMSLITFIMVTFVYTQFSFATVTVTETDLAQPREENIYAIVGSNDVQVNPVAAHNEMIVTTSQTSQVPTTGVQHIQATQAQDEITFYNADLVVHFVPAGTIIAVPHSALRAMTDESVTIPAGDLSGNGQANTPAHIIQVGAVGNIAAHTLYGTTCCSSDMIRVDNLRAFTGGQDENTYSIVQQSDIQNAAQPLEASEAKSGPTLLQKHAHTDEVLIPASVNCMPMVSPTAAVGSRAATVSVTVTSTCNGIFYSTKMLNSYVRTQYNEDESHKLGNAYSLVGNVRVDAIGATPLPVKNGVARLLLQAVAVGVWRFNFKEARQKLLQSIVGKEESAARVLLKQRIYKQGVNKVEVQITWNYPRIFTETLPSDSNRIRLVPVQK